MPPKNPSASTDLLARADEAIRDATQTVNASLRLRQVTARPIYRSGPAPSVSEPYPVTVFPADLPIIPRGISAVTDPMSQIAERMEQEWRQIAPQINAMAIVSSRTRS